MWEGALARDAAVTVETPRRGLKPPPTATSLSSALLNVLLVHSPLLAANSLPSQRFFHGLKAQEGCPSPGSLWLIFHIKLAHMPFISLSVGEKQKNTPHHSRELRHISIA